ncbi:hypothetical protein [Pelotalea chapellei]|uniref:Uncharacterized protein n=1 Tax=Pelotalea chapellei TaxID=44671 RepID=A0ABS5U5B0_9BACT|nr:hypothetical protein [Pelotalea chapellei]MBT1070847.1 hypothetical protein [Pelotalea chapellei]
MSNGRDKAVRKNVTGVTFKTMSLSMTRFRFLGGGMQKVSVRSGEFISNLARLFVEPGLSF